MPSVRKATRYGDRVVLDSDLTTGDPAATVRSGASHTVHSQGLMTDVVKGGLKTDLSLGFEMSDSDFAKPSWNGVPNPPTTNTYLAPNNPPPGDESALSIRPVLNRMIYLRGPHRDATLPQSHRQSGRQLEWLPHPRRRANPDAR